MAEDIQSVINDGAHQHARLAHALERHEATDLGFAPAQADALAAPLSVEVVVCLDDVTVWSTETHKLRHLVALPDNPQVPWVLSLADLLVVTDLLQGVELVHYVTRRLRIEAEQKVEAHDELDWVGHYITDGLFFDTYFEAPDAPDIYRLTTYTEFIDTWYFARAGLLNREISRPQQELPTELRELLQRLERDRPRHWLIAGLLLLNGDMATRRQLVDLMGHTAARAKVVGRCSATQVFPEYSLTLTVDLWNNGSALKNAMRRYWHKRIEQHGRPNAVMVGLGANHRLAIDVLQTDPSLTISRVLLARTVTSTTEVVRED